MNMKWKVVETYYTRSGGFVDERPVVEFHHPTDAKKYAEWLNSLKITGIVSGLVYNVKRKIELPRNLSPGQHYSADLLKFETKENEDGTKVSQNRNREKQRLPNKEV